MANIRSRLSKIEAEMACEYEGPPDFRLSDLVPGFKGRRDVPPDFNHQLAEVRDLVVASVGGWDAIEADVPSAAAAFDAAFARIGGLIEAGNHTQGAVLRWKYEHRADLTRADRESAIRAALAFCSVGRPLIGGMPAVSRLDLDDEAADTIEAALMGVVRRVAEKAGAEGDELVSAASDTLMSIDNAISRMGWGPLDTIRHWHRSGNQIF